MIALLRPQPDARSIGQPEPAALGLLMGDLQPLALPDTLDPLVVDCPARLAQQFGDLAIAIAAVLERYIVASVASRRLRLVGGQSNRRCAACQAPSRACEEPSPLREPPFGCSRSKIESLFWHR
jgi:hypothetical protein